MPSVDEPGLFPNMSQNYQRGLTLLRLATEQVRIFDPDTADFINKHYLEPVNNLFDRAARATDYTDVMSRDDAHGKAHRVRQMSKIAWQNDIQPQMPPTPPGLGYEGLGFQEAKADQTSNFTSWGALFSSRDEEITPRASSSHSRAYDSPWSYAPQPASFDSSLAASRLIENVRTSDRHAGEDAPRKDFGAIGSQPVKAKSSQASRADSRLSTLFNSSTLESQPHSGDDTSFGTSKVPTIPNQGLPIRGSSERGPVAKSVRDPTRAEIEAYVEANKEQLLASFVSSKAVNNSFYDSSSSVQSPDPGTSSDPSWSFVSQPQRRPSGLQNVFEATSSASAHSGAVSDEVASVPQALPPAPGPSSWAKIAAITAENGGEPDSAVTIELSTRANTALKSHQRHSSKPLEPKQDQIRVIWLSHVPDAFRLRDVSLQITQGPVMSILLQQDVDPILPGKSACIIFKEAEHASLFLQDNGWDFDKQRSAGPTSYATSPVRPGSRRPDGVSKISLIPGGPYPLDAPLLSMNHPTHARRRIKWSRSRLFYDVSQRQFKKDVLSTVGGPTNVELFHFYNPGECTVIFASVGVATACLAAFDEWKDQKLEGATRWMKEDDARQGKVIGYLDKKKGKYEGVDVGFVKDFNEAPGKLYTHYGKNGQFSERVEGLFEGPNVSWPPRD